MQGKNKIVKQEVTGYRQGSTNIVQKLINAARLVIVIFFLNIMSYRFLTVIVAIILLWTLF